MSSALDNTEPASPRRNSIDGSVSEESFGREDEKTIPFLRRLRDMLKENEGYISFVPGYRSPGKAVLGRIVVHDRIEVEAKVLPRYFNHSSFASLRRQLNYFSFVRLGKGRQRESTYVNEHVVELDDILLLKRRPATASPSRESSVGSTLKDQLYADLATSSDATVVIHSGPVLNLGKAQKTYSVINPKRRRQSKRPTKPPMSVRSASPQQNLISEDETPQIKPTIALDLTKPDVMADLDMLEGCRGLLTLASSRWD